MRRIIMMLTVALVMAALVAATIVPAMALNSNQGAQGCQKGSFLDPPDTVGCPNTGEGPPNQTGFGAGHGPHDPLVVVHCQDTTEQHVVVSRPTTGPPEC
jgi:hypothetical protein